MALRRAKSSRERDWSAIGTQNLTPRMLEAIQRADKN
jgi:hypothetical protein